MQDKILVITWPHEVEIPSASGGRRWADPIWDELSDVFQLPANARYTSFLTGYDQVANDLWTYKLRQEQRDQLRFLHPRLEGRFGRWVSPRADKRIVLFRSDLRLNTDGPTMPVRVMLTNLIRDVDPRLVISVGFGGGVTAADQVGDVLVATQARYRLNGDLQGSEVNGKTYGGGWQPSDQVFAGLNFAQLQEPALEPPSPNYECPTPLPQPPPHQPQARLADKPVLTFPRLIENRFTLGSPDAGDRDYVGDEASAVDMDAATAAEACDGKVDCGLVVGLAVPALKRFPGQDSQQALRNGWADYFFALFAQATARHCAETVRALCN